MALKQESKKEQLTLIQKYNLKRQTMNDNSKEAFNAVLPDLQKRELTVIEALRGLGKATMHQVAEKMNVGVNTISGRFTRLVRIRKIKAVDRAYYTHIYEDGTSRRVPRSIFTINQ